jgi:hypothetical protein
MVGISRCEHIFHRKCLIGWAESTNPQRDTCPSCREVVYQRENLTAEEIDSVGQEEDEEELEEIARALRSTRGDSASFGTTFTPVLRSRAVD